MDVNKDGGKGTRDRGKLYEAIKTGKRARRSLLCIGEEAMIRIQPGDLEERNLVSIGWREMCQNEWC